MSHTKNTIKLGRKAELNLLLANQAAWARASRLSSGFPGPARFGKGAPGIGLFKIEFIRHKKRALEGLVLWVTEAFGSFLTLGGHLNPLGTASEGFCAVLEWVMVLEPCSVATKICRNGREAIVKKINALIVQREVLATFTTGVYFWQFFARFFRAASSLTWKKSRNGTPHPRRPRKVVRPAGLPSDEDGN